MTHANRELEGDFLARLGELGNMSFAEVVDWFAPHMPVEGTVAIEAPDCPNLLIWAGMSEELVGLLQKMGRAKLFHYEPTVLLVYLVDGKHLDLPIAKRPPKKGYKEPHWVPVVLKPGPST